MDGERAQGAASGRPIPGITANDGTFSYAEKPKGPGIYSFAVQGPWVLRLATDPPGKEKTSVLCARLDGRASFDLVGVPLQAIDASARILNKSVSTK
jgi:hypothetical protein